MTKIRFGGESGNISGSFLRGLSEKADGQSFFFSKSGRKAFVRSKDCCSSHSLILASCPESKISGHGPAFIIGWTGIYGSCQQVVLERVGEGALFVADDTGHDTYDGIRHDSGCQFSARQYVISYTDFFRDEVFTDAGSLYLYNVRTG